MPSIRDLNISSVSLGNSPGGDSGSLASDRRLASPILALLAAVAMAVVALIAVQPTWAQDATIEYAENGKDTVVTLTAADPENDTVTWSVTGGTDQASFTIGPNDGMLKFSSPPDYEGNTAGGGDSDNDNTYEVVVTASSPDGAGGTNTDTFTVNVKVTNVDEAGKVSWGVDHDADNTADTPTLVQFEVGAILSVDATGGVTDGDVPGADKNVTERLQWSRSSSMTGPWTPIKGETGATYTVATDDIGMYIRVDAFYNVGTGREESASQTADYPVLAERSSNDAPEFSPASVNREVSEGKKGMTVGAPVTATDDISNALNYVLTGVDRGRFKIDQKTGQITTDADLDYDETTVGSDGGTEDQCVTANSCMVTVTATDSTGAPSGTPATVTIKITNVDEKPEFATGFKMRDVAEGMTQVDDDADATNAPAGEAIYAAMDPDGMDLNMTLMGTDAAKFELTGANALSFRAAPDYEMPTDANRDNVYEVTVRASDGTMYADRMVRVTVTDENEDPKITGMASVNYVENGKDPVTTLSATDPENDPVTWSVTGGTDQASFTIGPNDGMLKFSSPPDYEGDAAGGGDSDNDNTYEVVVTASSPDGAGGTNTDTFTVNVKVTNVSERGKVTWTTTPSGGSATTPTLLQFHVGTALAITATDDDIPGATKTVTDNVSRQWYRGSSVINGQTDATYTTTTQDVGQRIRVVVSYTVGTGREEQASLTSDYPVLATRSSNNDPEFSPTAVNREVSEGKKGMNVGAPVTATDDITNALNYALAGVDRGRFKIDQKTGQITTDADLDYDETTLGTDGGTEDQCAVRNSCVVTVTATDAAGLASGTPATVTIKITNVDEKPEFVTDTTATPGAASPKAITRVENMTALADTGSEVNVTYLANDPDGLRVNRSLTGADAAKFQLSPAGVLSFRAAPDYEMPTDANGNNVYEVTVRASDGTMHADRMVEVTVTDENEDPKISSGNVAPRFASATTTRDVAENTEAGMDIGDPVMATDANGDDLTYSLGGSDAASFSIGSTTGQLMTSAALDYETKMTYMVTVTATDPDGLYAMIDVTINVTDETEEVQTLMQRYDADSSGAIEKSEMIDAINDYLFGEGADQISKEDMITVINYYLFG